MLRQGRQSGATCRGTLRLLRLLQLLDRRLRLRQQLTLPLRKRVEDWEEGNLRSRRREQELAQVLCHRGHQLPRWGGADEQPPSRWQRHQCPLGNGCLLCMRLEKAPLLGALPLPRQRAPRVAELGDRRHLGAPARW